MKVGRKGFAIKGFIMRYMDQAWAWKEGCSGALMDSLE